MARLLSTHLRRLGHEVTVAYYATLREHPELVAPSWRLVSGARASEQSTTCFGDVPSVAIGCWLPEFEFPYYLSSARWKNTIRTHDRHIAIGGTPLISYPFLKAEVRHLVWCATTMNDDRLDRRRAMPLPRRLLDHLLVSPVQAIMEQAILRGPGCLMPISRHSAKAFGGLGKPADEITVLPVPVDTARFTPPEERAPVGVIGFAGRINDPRNNIGLLIEAVKRARAEGADVSLSVTGSPDRTVENYIKASGVEGHILFVGNLPDEALPNFDRGLDLFVIPSRHERLCIAGLEAMASGVPVISTRCGGPEDFVVDGVSGYLTNHDSGDIAQRILELTKNRKQRREMGHAARSLVEARYEFRKFAEGLGAAWQQTWEEAP